MFKNKSEIKHKKNAVLLAVFLPHKVNKYNFEKNFDDLKICQNSTTVSLIIQLAYSLSDN